MVGTTLGATIDPNGIIATTSGSGAMATVSNSIAIVSSGSSNSGYGQLQSKTKARYIYGQPHAWRGVGRLSVVGVPNCTRRFGMFDTSGSNVPNNGTYFEFSSTGVLSVNTVSGGSVSNSVSNGSFNGDVSEYTLDTNVHTYEIIAFTTGVWFYIDNVLIHSIKPTVALLYQSLTVPITAKSRNSASGTTSGTLEVWNTSISRLGRNITAPVYKYQSGTTAGLNLKIGAGSLHNIIISNINNNADVTLYDSTSATGSVIFSTGPMANNSTPYSIPFGGLSFYNGLTMVISGANCNVTLVYE